MTQYNSLNAKLSNSKLNNLKSAIRNKTEVVLRLSCKMTDNSDDETNLPLNLLLTNTHIVGLRKAFANNLSVIIKLSKTQLFEMIQSGRFLGRPLGPLLKAGLPLAKIVLIALGLTAAVSAAEAEYIKSSWNLEHNTNNIKWWNGRHY